MNIAMIKVVSSMFKKHKLFLLILVVTEIYRFKIVHFLLIFGLWKRDHVTRRLQTWCTYTLYLHSSFFKFQRSTFSNFVAYKRIDKFSRQKWQFFLKFRIPKSRSRELGSSNLAYMMLLIIIILYPKFKFLCWARF